MKTTSEILVVSPIHLVSKQKSSLKFLLVVFIFISGSFNKASCQEPFSEYLNSYYPSNGYIITQNGDSLTGKIRSKKHVDRHLCQISFEGSNGERKLLTSEDIKQFGIFTKVGGIDVYECRPSIKSGMPVFMLQMLKGKISVFRNETSTTTTFVDEKDHSKLTGIEFSYEAKQGFQIGPAIETTTSRTTTRWYSSYFIEKDNGKLIKIDKKNIIELWASLFGDCPEFDQYIQQNPELKKFKNFIQLVDTYNHICH